jgi:replicative DNA helicase
MADHHEEHQQRPLRIEESGAQYPLSTMTGARKGPRPANVVPLHDGGRVPPQAVDVEQSVLGALLIEREAIPKAIEVLQADAFYETRHQRIYAAVQGLFERGNPVDLVTLTEELKRRGDYEGIGGYYLSELTTRVASAANVEYHARIIAEKSLLRKLIATMTGVVGQAYDPTTDAFDLLDDAERQIFQISESQLRRGAVPMREVVRGTFEQLHRLHGRVGGITGVPSGFTSLDNLTGGWQNADLIIIAARPSMGKCLGRGTRLMMYDGTLKAVEDVRVGDLLMGDDSTPRRVRSLARGREMMYWVRQRHGVDYRVNESHILSLKKSRREGRVPRGAVVNLSVRDYLGKSGKWKSDHKGYKVAVEFPEQPLPVDPYLLGVWLGDGKTDDARIYTTDEEVVAYLHAYAEADGAEVRVGDVDRPCPSYRITKGRSRARRETSLRQALRELGVLGDKHVPEAYLVNSRRNRLLLLAGLIDSDGLCNKGHGGAYEITQASERLAWQIKFLCDTLGYRTSLRAKTARTQHGTERTVWRVRFNGDVDAIPVRIERKKAPPWADFRDWTVTGVTVEPDRVDDYYGFELDGNRLFLLEDGTVTHNTAMSLAMMRNAALHPEKAVPVAYFSLEMSAGQLAQRLLTSEARVDAQAARTGRLHDDEWPKLARAAGRLAEAPVFIDDTPGLGILELRAKCRRLKAEHGIGLVIVDYLQLMHGTTQSKNGNREQEIAQISRSLKGLAKELDVPVVALSQLSRAVETRGGDKRPQLSDLRESGSIEQDADVVGFIYRAERYGITVDENGNSTEGLAEVIIGKQRNGPIGSVKLAFVNQYARFENLTSYLAGDTDGGYGGGYEGGSYGSSGHGGGYDTPPPLPPVSDAPF